MLNRPILSSQILIVGPEAAVQAVRDPFQNQPEAWSCLRAESAGEAMWRLRQEPGIDALVVAPGRSIESFIDLARHLKFSQSGGILPVVFILEADLSHQRAKVYESGADDCIQLPAPREEIVLRLLNAIRIKQATDSLENATAVITSLASAIEGRDRYTCGHVERVAMYATEIARRVGVPERELTTVRIGGMVHDIGKVVVPDQILNKPGRLTDEEMDVIKRHPVVGYEILKPLRTLQEALPIVRWHHEKPNGRGYPDGLKGDEVPLLARIVAVADCFDAISTDRPYRPALPMQDCRKIMLEMGAKEDLSGDLVAILLDISAQDTERLSEVGAYA